MKYFTSAQAAEKTGLTKRRINDLCKAGLLEGAVKDGYRWLIPEKTIEQKMESIKTSARKALPIGVSDYKNAVSNYYYVDKTLLIKDLIDYRPLVSLFTRPRRFGKTLNMDMLRVFFEKADEDTGKYFADTDIWRAGEQYREEQGRYPAVFFTFKDIKFNNWTDMYTNIKFTIQSEYRRHINLKDSDILSPQDKEYFNAVLENRLEESLYASTLYKLTYFLKLHYETGVMVFIDEYDTPIQQGYLCGFYEEIVGFMRNFLSGGLKDNPNLTMAFLTGILRVAKESIFSGLNNLNVDSVLEDRYSTYFGFTETEVKMILKDYGLDKESALAKTWYDGYHFGKTEIYNPWSVLNFIDSGAKAKAYWQATGSNSVIGDIVREATDEVTEKLQKLLNGEKIETYIDISVVYPEIHDNAFAIFSFLLMAGYLTIDTVEDLDDGNSFGSVYIPNREVRVAYEKEIISQLEKVVSRGSAVNIQQALVQNDEKMLEQELNKFLMNTVSFYDTSLEGFYHGMMLGLSALLSSYYEIKSNREEGNGRYDIQLRPHDRKRSAYILELKAVTGTVKEENLNQILIEMATDAVMQVQDKKYYTQLIEDGCSEIIVYGMAFYKKTCHIEKKKY